MSCKYLGVNFPGAESSWEAHLPGTQWVDYQYTIRPGIYQDRKPNITFTANTTPATTTIAYPVPYILNMPPNVAYYASKGINLIRLPVRWERIQSTLNGPLNITDIQYVDEFIDFAGQYNMWVLLDIHNYGYWYPNAGDATINWIGSTAVPVSCFTNLWSQLAWRYINKPHVIFGLMNEPHYHTPIQWANAAQSAIDAIRATGSTNTIFCPGTYYTKSESWTTASPSNAQSLVDVRDPLGKMSYEVHMYMDGDGSGADQTTVISNAQIGVSRVTEITKWARAKRKKLFLGEYACPSDSTSLVAMENLLTFIDANSDVWDGTCYWAGGYWYGLGNGFNIEPTWSDSPAANYSTVSSQRSQMTVLANHPHA